MALQASLLSRYPTCHVDDLTGSAMTLLGILGRDGRLRPPSVRPARRCTPPPVDDVSQTRRSVRLPRQVVRVQPMAYAHLTPMASVPALHPSLAITISGPLAMLPLPVPPHVGPPQRTASVDGEPVDALDWLVPWVFAVVGTLIAGVGALAMVLLVGLSVVLVA